MIRTAHSSLAERRNQAGWAAFRSRLGPSICGLFLLDRSLPVAVYLESFWFGLLWHDYILSSITKIVTGQSRTDNVLVESLECSQPAGRNLESAT